MMGIDPRLVANTITESPDVPALKLKAFPFDADPLGGDHVFYAPTDAVDFCEGDTFETLVDRVKENLDPLDTTIEGFWVVTDRDCHLADKVWPMVDKCQDGPGNDSAIYRYNHAAKRLLKQAAIGVVDSSGYRRV